MVNHLVKNLKGGTTTFCGEGAAGFEIWAISSWLKMNNRCRKCNDAAMEAMVIPVTHLVGNSVREGKTFCGKSDVRIADMGWWHWLMADNYCPDCLRALGDWVGVQMEREE